MAPRFWRLPALVAALLAPVAVEGLRKLEDGEAAPSARADGLQLSPEPVAPGRSGEVVAGGRAAAVDGPRAICADSGSVRLATSTLRQLGPEAQLGELRVSAAQLSDYFVASTASVAALLRELAIDSAAAVDVASLCSRCMGHIADVLKWPFPEWRGHLCAAWSPELRCLDWVPVSGAAVQEKAQRLDLASELAHLGDHRASDHEHADFVQHAISGQAGNATAALAAAFDYSVGDLAVQIANLFDIYPTDPGLSSSSSFLEASDKDPPVFGPRVRWDRYPIWTETMARSEAWVDSAFRKVAAHPKLLKAWFGSDAPGMQSEVRRVLAGMRKTLGKAKIRVGEEYYQGQVQCHDSTGVMAYVIAYVSTRDGSFQGGEMDCEENARHFGFCDENRKDRYVINVCPRYWLPEFWNADASRYGTMIHESAHHHGPVDADYKKSGPYGRAPCLRMARESPKSAVNNADNFKWYVYYLNRCAGRRGAPLEGSPCGLKARRDFRGAEVRLSCDGRPVSGLTLRVLRASGEYAQAPDNFGDHPRQGAWSASIFEGHAQSGQTFVLFYETDCAFWEARAAYDTLGHHFREHRSEPVMDMADARGGRDRNGGCRGLDALASGLAVVLVALSQLILL